MTFSDIKHVYFLLITLLVLLSSEYLSGQKCPVPNPDNGAYLYANHIRAYYTASGSQFFDGNDGQFRIFNNAAGIETIFAPGIWLGAKDANGNIRLALAQYGLNYGRHLILLAVSQENLGSLLPLMWR
ncbi:MAG: hypothetical protein AAFU03_11800 [Bacteroidota bacterium]